jgi:rod shape-determining protein MreC
MAVALITIDFRGGGDSAAHDLGGRIFGPVERLAGRVSGSVTGDGGRADAARLQRQNDQLQAQLAQAQTSAKDAQQLARLLRLAGKYQVVAATVIAAGGDYADTVTINAGRADGIAVNETVLNGAGLVGTVTATTPDTATVQLTTDAAATVGIRMNGSGQLGALSGSATAMTGATALKLTLFSASATLKPGQELVTFGSVGGRPYVAGLPVGVVSQVTTQPGALTPTALVRPYADFTSLGVVGVVVSK